MLPGQERWEKGQQKTRVRKSEACFVCPRITQWLVLYTSNAVLFTSRPPARNIEWNEIAKPIDVSMVHCFCLSESAGDDSDWPTVYFIKDVCVLHLYKRRPSLEPVTMWIYYLSSPSCCLRMHEGHWSNVLDSTFQHIFLGKTDLLADNLYCRASALGSSTSYTEMDVDE